MGRWMLLTPCFYPGEDGVAQPAEVVEVDPIGDIELLEAGQQLIQACGELQPPDLPDQVLVLYFKAVYRAASLKYPWF